MASEMTGTVDGFFVDENYEFSAPKFFDLLNNETDEEIREAELWFKNGKSDDPSRKHLYSLITQTMHFFFMSSSFLSFLSTTLWVQLL